MSDFYRPIIITYGTGNTVEGDWWCNTVDEAIGFLNKYKGQYSFLVDVFFRSLNVDKIRKANIPKAKIKECFID